LAYSAKWLSWPLPFGQYKDKIQGTRERDKRERDKRKPKDKASIPAWGLNRRA
jgi:hypothetical protein